MIEMASGSDNDDGNDGNGATDGVIVEVGRVGDDGYHLRAGGRNAVDRLREVARSVRGPLSYRALVEDIGLGPFMEAGKAIVGAPGRSDRVRGVPHEYDFDLYTGLYKSESLVFRGINITADHVMYPGFIIEGGSDEDRELIEEWSRYVGLDVLLHDAVKALLIWGNAYFEVVKDDTVIGGIILKPVPPSTMFVYRTETGSVIGYIQIPKNRRFWRDRASQYIRPKLTRLPKVGSMGDLDTERKRGWKGQVREAYPDAIPFDADEIIHIKHNALPGAEYGLSTIEPMLMSLTIYQGMRVDIGVISRRYAAPKTLWLIGDENMPATDEMMDSFKYYMDAQNIGDDVVVPSWIKFEVLGAGQMTMDLAPYLALLRDDVFAGLSVPEILMGGTIKGTLASAKIQLESFSRRIVMIQRLLVNVCEREIFPRVLGMEYPLSAEDWRRVPRMVFRPIETEEQRYIRVMNEYSTGMISREEARRQLRYPSEVDGHMSIDDQIRLQTDVMKAQVELGLVGGGGGTSKDDGGDTRQPDPTRAGSRGPRVQTGGGGDDKKKAEKPITPKDQGGNVGQ